MAETNALAYGSELLWYPGAEVL